jgi:hypothetical protein
MEWESHNKIVHTASGKKFNAERPWLEEVTGKLLHSQP